MKAKPNGKLVPTTQQAVEDATGAAPNPNNIATPSEVEHMTTDYNAPFKSRK